jgi:hypothetical protein
MRASANATWTRSFAPPLQYGSICGARIPDAMSVVIDGGVGLRGSVKMAAHEGGA